MSERWISSTRAALSRTTARAPTNIRVRSPARARSCPTYESAHEMLTPDNLRIIRDHLGDSGVPQM
ncbi:hypothetical protein V2I01_16595 [Micromonospora sp. BRA006-A]|nr:hypothetical protein [Micromonospora sp. BRA006-A]